MNSIGQTQVASMPAHKWTTSRHLTKRAKRAGMTHVSPPAIAPEANEIVCVGFLVLRVLSIGLGFSAIFSSAQASRELGWVPSAPLMHSLLGEPKKVWNQPDPVAKTNQISEEPLHAHEKWPRRHTGRASDRSPQKGPTATDTGSIWR